MIVDVLEGEEVENDSDIEFWNYVLYDDDIDVMTYQEEFDLPD